MDQPAIVEVSHADRYLVCGSDSVSLANPVFARCREKALALHHLHLQANKFLSRQFLDSRVLYFDEMWTPRRGVRGIDKCSRLSKDKLLGLWHIVNKFHEYGTTKMLVVRGERVSRCPFRTWRQISKSTRSQEVSDQPFMIRRHPIRTMQLPPPS
jgi:hypothetical protein